MLVGDRDDEQARIARAAHLSLRGPAVGTNWAGVVSNAARDSNCQNGNARDCFTTRYNARKTEVVDVQHAKARYAVIRVEQDRWGELPPELRPHALPRREVPPPPEPEARPSALRKNPGWVQDADGKCWETRSFNCQDRLMHADYCAIPCPK